MKKNKVIYVPLAVDILHTGHLNIINKAKKYGKVVIGLLSDKAIAEYKALPSLGYNKRLNIVKNLKNVSKIIKQDSWDYSNVLKKFQRETTESKTHKSKIGSNVKQQKAEESNGNGNEVTGGNGKQNTYF